MPLPQLEPDECRVLGVLIEKAQTTPAQYPLTLNSLTTGCNQKNNRDPLTNYTEDAVLDAIDGLRRKEFVREAFLSGSRVAKYRHVAREVLQISVGEMAILAELLLRGPQSLSAVRSNCARMMPAGDASLATNESTQQVLDGLRTRPEPLVTMIAPAPGSGVRVTRFAQLLCPELHPLEAPDEASGVDTAAPSAPRSSRPADNELAARIESLERDLAMLNRAVRTLADSLGTKIELPER
ncbi:MAG TPA: DUF480 domain-containing protein [Phycisphaerales bacterium]|nr:DUF480 domain-containing protein [Phycisphaerales bacterium]